MSWCRSYGCRETATRNGYCVDCTHMLVAAGCYDGWPSGDRFDD